MQDETARKAGDMPDIPRRTRPNFETQGVVLLILGVLAILLPGVSTLALELLIGVIVLLQGILLSVSAARIWGAAGSTAALVAGLIAVLAGLGMLIFPAIGLLTLTAILGFFLILEGAATIAYGVALGRGGARPWLGLSGVAAALLGALILSGLPGSAGWALGLMLGTALLVHGLALLAIARRP
jgi:uncharacterized membrane protein HdeD (DUF308 family)